MINIIRGITNRLIIIVLFFSVVGCSSDPLKLTETDLGMLNNYDYKELRRMTVSASSIVFLGIIPIKMGGRELRARNAILERSGGDDIINPLVSSGYHWTPIGGIYTITLTATPIIKGKLKNYSQR